MKIFISISLLILANIAFAEFDERTIQPLLGFYKIKENKSKTCPSEVLLMAKCDKGTLSLRHPEQLEFEFLKFKDINAGEVTFTIDKKIIKKQKTIFQNLELKSVIHIFSNDKKKPLSIIEVLRFKENTMILKTRTYHCRFKYDINKDKEFLKQFI